MAPHFLDGTCMSKQPFEKYFVAYEQMRGMHIHAARMLKEYLDTLPKSNYTKTLTGRRLTVIDHPTIRDFYIKAGVDMRGTDPNQVARIMIDTLLFDLKVFKIYECRRSITVGRIEVYLPYQ